MPAISGHVGAVVVGAVADAVAAVAVAAAAAATGVGEPKIVVVGGIVVDEVDGKVGEVLVNDASDNTPWINPPAPTVGPAVGIVLGAGIGGLGMPAMVAAYGGVSIGLMLLFNTSGNTCGRRGGGASAPMAGVPVFNDSGDANGWRRGGASAPAVSIPLVSADATAVGIGVNVGSYNTQGDALLLSSVNTVGTKSCPEGRGNREFPPRISLL